MCRRQRAGQAPIWGLDVPGSPSTGCWVKEEGEGEKGVGDKQQLRPPGTLLLMPVFFMYRSNLSAQGIAVKVHGRLSDRPVQKVKQKLHDRQAKHHTCAGARAGTDRRGPAQACGKMLVCGSRSDASGPGRNRPAAGDAMQAIGNPGG